MKIDERTIVAALVGYAIEREKILSKMAELRRLIAAGTKKSRRPHNMSEDGRKRIADAQHKRWAKHRLAPNEQNSSA